MTSVSLHHVAVNVDDLESAIAFYVGELGLTVREDRPELVTDGRWLDAGFGQIHLNVAAVAPDTGQHLALLVEDLDATVVRLRNRGLEISTPVPIGRARQSFLHDPAGNRVELQQGPAAASPDQTEAC
jgi:glyoxylase I family protein